MARTATRGKTDRSGVSPALRSQGGPDIVVAPEYSHPLEAPEWQERLRYLQQWYRQARVAQADNRSEMAIDEDYYDANQIDAEDMKTLIDRNQPILTFNVTKNTVNWILGVERKNRIDYRVLPRKKKGAQGAKSKTQVMKYVQDCSKGEYQRSWAFESMVKAGLGWTEYGAQDGIDGCPIFERYEKWRNMWFDHLGSSNDGSDWRYVIRSKWADLDILSEMFPERADALRVLAEATNSLYPYLPDEIVIPDSASEFDLESDIDAMFGGSFNTNRKRVKPVECWYRMPATVDVLKMNDPDTPYGALHGVIFRKDHADHQYLVRGGYFSTVPQRMMTVRCAIWAGSTYLQDVLSPYNHQKFPFVPMFCYRRQRDGMPYGVIRDIRDPQSDLNKRRSRALVLLTANKVWYEKGSITDPVKFYEENNRPDGMAEVTDGALTGNKVKSQNDVVLAREHVELARDDERFIESISGVTPENKGTVRKDLSGKAIEAIQLQGHTTSGVFFDNYYYAFQNAGEMKVSLIEQFIDQMQEFRITGDRQKDDFLTVNEPQEDGSVKNSMQDVKADFIVTKQDFRETLRLTMLQMLTDLILGLAQSGQPNVGLAILDLAVDMMDDLPNKDEIIARIRKINGQRSPDEETTPEEKAKLEAQDQAAAQESQMMKALQTALLQAEVSVKNANASNQQAQATKNQVDAQMKKLDGFLKALEAAGMLATAPALAGAADTLVAESQNLGGGNGAAPRQMSPMESQGSGPIEGPTNGGMS